MSASRRCGPCDLLAIRGEKDERSLGAGIVHGAAKGGVLLGFTCLMGAEHPHYPAISQGAGFMSAEFVLLCAMVVGNHLGGRFVWGAARGPRPPYQA
jgi:hypothetical protein